MAAKKPSKRRTRHKTVAPPLSAREIRFCQLWVETGNVTRSFIDAGLPHASENVAAHLGRRLFRKVQIREYVRHLQNVAAECAKTTVEELGALLANIARADRRRLFDKSGRMLPPHLWPDDVAACVESVEMGDAPKLLMGRRRGEKGSRGAKAKLSDMLPPAPVKKVKTASRIMAATKLMEWKKQEAADKSSPGDGSGSGSGSPGSSDGASAGLDFLGRLAALLAPLQPQPRPSDGVDATGEAGTPVDPVPRPAGDGLPQPG